MMEFVLNTENGRTSVDCQPDNLDFTVKYFPRTEREVRDFQQIMEELTGYTLRYSWYKDNITIVIGVWDGHVEQYEGQFEFNLTIKDGAEIENGHIYAAVIAWYEYEFPKVAGEIAQTVMEKKIENYLNEQIFNQDYDEKVEVIS